MKKFTSSHEWIEINGEIGTVGITDYAQSELGEIVFVELPDVGHSFEKGEEAVVLESTKAAADVYSPVSGEVVEVNEKLADASELVNDASETDGWLFKIKLSDSSECDALMDETKYKEMI